MVKFSSRGSAPHPAAAAADADDAADEAAVADGTCGFTPVAPTIVPHADDKTTPTQLPDFSPGRQLTDVPISNT